jgi:hypothetical protein
MAKMARRTSKRKNLTSVSLRGIEVRWSQYRKRPVLSILEPKVIQALYLKAWADHKPHAP